MSYKLGSLFDGSGGFPLAGSLCGIEPRWAAEVEPYPIAVTRSRFPNMKHLGDISKVHGGEIEPVDIITFGSPCQDLSVAGKRAGLKHEANGDEETTRSGLFMEAVRIIKEMRRATNGEYPRFAIWENVPGAFSSNKGEDFRIVCEELIKIVEPSAFMPTVPQNGWNYADSFIGDGWSLAYRVFDAQYWGVPQRRRRIYLVADLRGECAREILFEREGLRGYFAEGRTPWQEAAADAQGCAGADDREGEGNGGDRGRQLDAVAYTLKIRSGCEGGGKGALIQEDKSATLATNNDQYLFQPITDTHIIDNIGGQAEYAKASSVNGTLRAGAQGLVAYAVENHPADSRVDIDDSGKVQTLTSRMGTGGGNVPMVMEEKPVICLQGNGIDRADTAGCNGKGWKEDTCYTLNTIDRPAVAYGLDRASFNQGQNAKFDFSVTEEQQPTLTAKGPGAVAFQSYQEVTGPLMANSHPGSYTGQDAFSDMLVAGEKAPTNYIVRRLTPTECARLQGFADWWGVIEPKDALTDEEYHFWLEVRNTHARINGKKEQDYTPKQMLTWYNKLWTDSAEYKMWGNGIALPTALYCIQGMAEVLARPIEEDPDDWMN